MPKLTSTGEHLYDDSNFHELLGDGEKVTAGGTVRYLKSRPRGEHPRYASYGSVPGSKKFEEVIGSPIPRSQWSALIKEMEAKQMRNSDWCDFDSYDQASTNYCWVNAPTQGFTLMRRKMGLPLVVISAASVGGPVTNYSNVGGWGSDALAYLASDGGVPVEQWPANAISKSYFANTQALRVKYKALEWFEVPANNFDAMATCLLLGLPCPVGYNWWSHEVLACDLVETSSGVFGIRIRNSWGQWGDQNKYGKWGFSLLSESKGTPDDIFAYRSVTASE